MAPPTPIGSFIPPVTGLNKNLRPFANNFDESGFFRSRTGSVKRRRPNSPPTEIENRFDLAQQYPPLVYPDRPGIDLAAVRNHLVSAAGESEKIKLLLAEGGGDDATRALANSAIALYNLVEAIVEKAVVPMWQSGQRQDREGGGVSGDAGGGDGGLREALKKADLESIVFDADLGPGPTFNRSKLSAALSAGLKARVINHAENKNNDVAEAVRVLDDAFGGVEDVDFLGKETKSFSNSRDKDDPRNGKFCTMPVKLRFSDRDSRIFFETTIKKLGGPRTVQSFPAPIRKEMSALAEKVRGDNPGKIVMVKPDLRSLAMVVSVKEDGDARWERLGGPVPFTAGIMTPRFRTDTPPTGGQSGQSQGPTSHSH